jgi:uncharacterized protein (DUF952 family)
MTLIFKVCSAQEWQAAVAADRFAGSPVDLSDGFVHFSTADQLTETVSRHFGGVTGLVLVAFDDRHLGPHLRYEKSRGEALFPHLYGQLDPKLALWVRPLPIGADGSHDFPVLEA